MELSNAICKVRLYDEELKKLKEAEEVLIRLCVNMSDNDMNKLHLVTNGEESTYEYDAELDLTIRVLHNLREGDSLYIEK